MSGVILIVEDDEELNELLGLNLTRAGYCVVQAWDGVSAMEAIRDVTPDLVLLDIMLPHTDGWEVYRYLADALQQPHLPVIIISAKGDREDLEQARRFGAAGYFIKPFEMAAVLRRVQESLARKGRPELEELSMNLTVHHSA